MAEPSSPDQWPTLTESQSRSGHGASEYWCYHCDKRVTVETLADLPDVVCCECKNGFVEAVSAASGGAPDSMADLVDDPNFGSQFIQVLRLMAQAAREEEAPPPPPSDPADYLRIELDGWDNDSDGGGAAAAADEHSVEIVHEEEADDRERYGGEDRSDDQEDEEIEVIDGDGDEEEGTRRRVRDALRLRLRDIASRAANRRNRILDWAEILMGLENHSIELRLQVPDSDDDYVGNPADYVDAAGYEALLQNLVESDSEGRRGAPPASKAAVEALESVVIVEESGSMVCAVCKDTVNVGETAKNLPCGHGYHCECIIPWLGSRNSCPVCRFELPTDDPEYEEERRKRALAAAGLKAASSSSSGWE